MLLYLFLCARFFFHTTQPLCSNFSILLPHNVPYGNAAAPRAFDSGYVTVAEDDRTVQATCWERATETKTWSYLSPPLEREGGITGLLHTIFKKIGFFVCIVLILPFLSYFFIPDRYTVGASRPSVSRRIAATSRRTVRVPRRLFSVWGISVSHSAQSAEAPVRSSGCRLSWYITLERYQSRFRFLYCLFFFSKGMDAPPASGAGGVQSLDNLCGDLNKGYIPKSPLGRNINGQSYPL